MANLKIRGRIAPFVPRKAPPFDAFDWDKAAEAPKKIVAEDANGRHELILFGDFDVSGGGPARGAVERLLWRLNGSVALDLRGLDDDLGKLRRDFEADHGLRFLKRALDGADVILGARGNDTLKGFKGADVLNGAKGADLLLGGGGGDKLKGGGGDDDLRGGGGRDVLRGQKGGDVLSGDGGNDTLVGGGGADTLDGGAKKDVLTGGAGEDVFVMSGGRDVVTDFRLDADVVRVNAPFSSLEIAATAQGAKIVSGGRTMILRGVDAAELSEANFRTQPESGGALVIGDAGPNRLRPDLPIDQEVRGLGGDDILGTGPGTNTLKGGPGPDIFAILPVKPNGTLDADVDRVADFSYLIDHDRIGLRAALAGVTFATLADVVELTPAAGGTMVRVRDSDALLLQGVDFTFDDIAAYGFDAPVKSGVSAILDPYGFQNTSVTSADPAITPDGQFVVYVSKAFAGAGTADVAPFTLENGDTNEERASMDVFLWNTRTDALELVSADPDGTVFDQDAFGGLRDSYSPAVSHDGRFVAFVTDGIDANEEPDVYLRDMLDPSVAAVPVSVDQNGDPVGGVPTAARFVTESVQIVDISEAGNKIAFLTDQSLAAGDANGVYDIYVRDVRLGVTRLASADEFGAAMGVPDAGFVSQSGDEDEQASQRFDMSANGQFVAFTSLADLGEGDTQADVYLRDLASGRTLLVSDGTAEPAFDPCMSDAGDVIVFETRSALDPGDQDGGLVDVYAADIDLDGFSVTGFRWLSGGDGLSDDFDFVDPVLSPDGSTVAFQAYDGFAIPQGLYVRQVEGGAVTKIDAFVDDSSGVSSSTTGYALSDEGASLVARVERTDDPSPAATADDMELFLL